MTYLGACAGPGWIFRSAAFVGRSDFPEFTLWTRFHIMLFGRSRFFFFFFPGKDSPVAMSREDLARDLWIHCTSRTKQLGLPYILRRLHPSETILSNKYLLTEMTFILPLVQFGISGPIPSRRPQKSAAADIKRKRALRLAPLGCACGAPPGARIAECGARHGV